jgi:hypothetical protein
MRVTTVESTTLATVGYDENLKRLQLEFSVVGLSTFTWAFPRRCSKRCSTRLRKAGISTGPSADVIPIVRSWAPIRCCRVRK